MKNIILIIAVIITLTSRVNSQSQNWQFNEVTLPPNSNFIDPGNKPFFVTADVWFRLDQIIPLVL